MPPERTVSWSVVPAGEGGDDSRGFEVSLDRAHHILRIRSWGIWDIAVADAYKSAMRKAFGSLRGRPWAVLSDRRRSSPQSEAVQAIIHDVMEEASKAGRTRAAVLIESASAKLQMRRLATETHVPQRYFASESEALAWLLGGTG
jgi:hypothetical protein